MMQKEIVMQLFLGKQNANASTNPIESGKWKSRDRIRENMSQ
jgi:hypothetical protein